MRGGFLVSPISRPPGAFGSPGGFPLPLPGSPEERFARRPAARFPHRVPSRVVPRIPISTVYYTSPAFYEPAVVDPTPQAVSVAPVVYVSPTVYVSTPAAAPPVPVVMASPVPPPPPPVVEYPTGRYELRGDGVGTPYLWVWVPNPPSAPPAASAAAPDEPRATSRSQIYRWTDEEGTVIWTNRVESIPEPQRPRAHRLGQVAAQP
jgi:hypothetical protein